MRKISVFCIVVLAAAEAAARTASPENVPGRLTVTLGPTENLTVGDRVEAELLLTWTGPEPAADPRFPTWGETWGPAEVLAVGEVESVADEPTTVPSQPRSSSTQRRPRGGRTYRQRVVLAAFRTGGIDLPPVTVAVPLAERTREVRSGGAAFEVLSVLRGEAAPPRPPAPPQALPPGHRFPATAALLTGLCVLVAVNLGKRLAAEREPAAAAPRSGPLEELVEHLAELDPETGSEPVHSRLSLALRRFLGRALGFRAPESTTSEIQHRLAWAHLPPAVARRTVDLLRDCDQAKFARREVAAAVTGERLAATRLLAREIDEHLRGALRISPPTPWGARQPPAGDAPDRGSEAR